MVGAVNWTDMGLSSRCLGYRNSRVLEPADEQGDILVVPK